jgi:DNA-binding transcriptional ArsR family regulator
MTKVSAESSHKKGFYIKCAEIFKVMSNAKRLEILNIIKDKEVTVNEISQILGTRKSNTSQHLAYLRYVGIVTARREGKNIFYKLVDPKIVEPCNTLGNLKINKFLT